MKLKELLYHINTPYHYIIILVMVSFLSLVFGILEPDNLLIFVAVAVILLTTVYYLGWSTNEQPKTEQVK